MKKWILGFILLLVVAIIFGEWLFNQPCPPPEKPKNVPIDAVWKGGCDGGNWIELVSIEKDKIRFRIFRDWNGDLILDANFKHQNCSNFELTKSNWSEQVAYFETTIELADRKGNNKRCSLEPIYPAYFKEKFDE